MGRGVVFHKNKSLGLVRLCALTVCLTHLVGCGSSEECKFVDGLLRVVQTVAMGDDHLSRGEFEDSPGHEIGVVIAGEEDEPRVIGGLVTEGRPEGTRRKVAASARTDCTQTVSDADR